MTAKSFESLPGRHSLWHTISNALIEAWRGAFMNKATQNMNSAARWELLILGSIFVGITMGVDAQLHSLVILPLLSSYFLLTAIIGYEPLYSLICKLGSYIRQRTSTSITAELKQKTSRSELDVSNKSKRSSQAKCH